jgi:hypothetical protein
MLRNLRLTASRHFFGRKAESHAWSSAVLGTHRKNKKGADLAARALGSLTRVYLQPEHDAQHSADAQHDVCAAFTVFANPNAITAINKATFIVFIVFSFKKWKELWPRGRMCPH